MFMVEGTYGASNCFRRIAGVLNKTDRRLAPWLEDSFKNHGLNFSVVASLKPTSCQINEELRSLCGQGRWKDALYLLDLRTLTGLDLTSAYICILKQCMDANAPVEGKLIHAHILKNGLIGNTFLKNTLIHMYVECGCMIHARDIFDSLSCKVVFAWTIMIGGYVKHGPLEEAFKLFVRMALEGVKPNAFTSVTILSACSTLTLLMHVHSYIMKVGVKINNYIVNKLVIMYSRLGSLKDALQVFKQFSTCDVTIYNAMIGCLGDHNCTEKAFQLYEKLKYEGLEPDEITFLNIAKACPSLGTLKQLHSEVNEREMKSKLCVLSAVVDMYANLGSVQDAKLLFDQMQVKDVPLWNTIILGYAQQGDIRTSFKMSKQMEKDGLASDKVTFLILLKACTAMGQLEEGNKIYTRLVERGLEVNEFVESALIDMYVKCGNIFDASYIFESISHADLVSWNVMIGGCSVQGLCSHALALFEDMEREAVKPDKVTFLALLKACASLGTFEQGMHIHVCIGENRLNTDAFISSALIDMYAKCGSINHAQEVFDALVHKDQVSWCAMMAGYAQHGHFERAFWLFSRMRDENVKLDDILFVGVLTACANAGLIEEGWMYFMHMKQLNIIVTAELCTCMVNLLGRTGCIKQAVVFVKQIAGGEPPCSSLTALLSNCRLYGYLVLAEKMSEKLAKLEPQSTSAFVLLSNVYAQGLK